MNIDGLLVELDKIKENITILQTLLSSKTGKKEWRQFNTLIFNEIETINKKFNEITHVTNVNTFVAGDTYTSNEKQMLQDIHDKLENLINILQNV